MEEQIVTLKVAKLAKEKGFDEKSLYCYDLDGNLRQNSDFLNVGCEGGLETDEHLLNYAYLRATKQGYLIVAPSQSLLQKWLRENFAIHIEIHRDEDMWKYELYEFSYGNKHILTGYKNYVSYELALEEAFIFVLTSGK